MLRIYSVFSFILFAQVSFGASDKATTIRPTKHAKQEKSISNSYGYRFYPRFSLLDQKSTTLYKVQYISNLKESGDRSRIWNGYLKEDLNPNKDWKNEVLYSYSNRDRNSFRQVGKIMFNDDGSIDSIESYESTFSIPLLLNTFLEGFPKYTTCNGVMHQRTSIIDTKDTCSDLGIQTIKSNLPTSRNWEIDYKFVNIPEENKFYVHCNGISRLSNGERRGLKTSRKSYFEFSWNNCQNGIYTLPKLDKSIILLTNPIQAFDKIEPEQNTGSTSSEYSEIHKLQEDLLSDIPSYNEGMFASALSYLHSATTLFKKRIELEEHYLLTLEALN